MSIFSTTTTMNQKTMDIMFQLLILMTLTGLSSQQSPILNGLPPYVQASESFINGTILFSFTATHPDNNEQIEIHTVGSMTSNIVFINQTHGGDISVDVITKSELDRDGEDGGKPGQGAFDLKFRATDSRSNDIGFQVQLYISDINDNSPVLHNWPYTWEIKELPYFGNDTYKQVNASDLDSGSKGVAGIRYRMEPTTQSESTANEYRATFEMDEIMGVVSLKKKLDYETNRYYQFNVTAQDDNGNGKIGAPADLIIRVLDVQDTAPFFTGIPYRQTIQENVTFNTAVITVVARDGDTGVPNPVNYTILPGNCSKLFNISQDGEIRTADEIDRDSGDISAVAGVCILTILVQEEENHQVPQYGNTTATTEVTVTIEDINDNPPKFGNETYTAKVQENTPQGVPITLIKPSEILISDADEDANARIELTLEYPNGTECHDFSISPTAIQKSGSVLIRVDNQKLLDFEMVQNITFLIKARDNVNPEQTSTVLVSVTDMNDNNPQFQNLSYNFNVEENSNTNTSVGTITATDADSDVYGNITYTISGGNNRFKVDQHTGTITTNCDHCSVELDREKVDIYYMTYTATDFGGRGRSNSTSLVIHITDENDNIPKFSRNLSSVFIDENDSKYNTTAVVKLEATDGDQEVTDNSKIVYSILTLSESHMRDNISIDNITGEIFLTDPVDFEELINKTGIIEIIVEARDLGEPSLASNATVLIHVQDINDNFPIFNLSLFREEITENSTSDVGKLTIVGKVFATDADGTDRNSILQYFIQAGAMDHFAINPSSGEVYVQINAQLDRETIPRYNITIIAFDQGSPPLNGTTTLSIDVLDVNDEFPEFNQSEYSTSVLEDELVGKPLKSCVASDKDINSDLQYTILHLEATDEDGLNVNSTLVKDYFKVNETSGSVYINGALDREVAKIVVLTIKVEDLKAYFPIPQTATALLTITLLDINDNHPEFQGLPYNVSVSENAQDPTILLTVSATDRDENRTITYQIKNTSAESNSFDINPNTGVLRKNGPLDREETSTITLNITATDNGVPPLGKSTEVLVTVIDFNDNEPEFVNFTNRINVPENATVGSFVLSVTASDADIGPNANRTYYIEDGDDGKFSIDPISGSITVSGLLDRETKPIYTLRIKVQDNPLNLKEQKSTSRMLTITLDDINDNSPAFQHQFYAESILENTNVGTSVVQVSADDVDEDGTNNSLISYSFGTNTSPPGLFRIDEASGEIIVNMSLIGHAGSYALGLIAEDHGEPKRINTSTANITVLDVNLNPPYITNLPNETLIKVYECVNVGYEIYQFNFTDDDIGVNANADFNITEIDVDDNIFDTFEIESIGILKVIKKLNALDKNSYRFQIHVTDRGVPPLSSDKITITVKVIDVNDHLPSFTKDKATFGVKENQPAGMAVGSVTAHDPDHDSVACYDIRDSDMSQVFAIGLNNGSIVTKTELDYENRTTFTFNVHVTDCYITGDISECGNITQANQEDYRDTISVTVNVIDANDNPPVFKVAEITVGMRRVTEVNTTLDLSLKTSDYIMDKDTDANGKQAWVFTNAGDIQTSASLSGIVNPLNGVMHCPSGDKKRHIVCVSGNGSLINNKYYNEDVSGYFVLPVNVSDVAGSDTVNVKIFLIGDSQILIMTVIGNKEVIAETKNDILKIYSQVTGYEFVYDWLEDHKTADGKVETFKTDLYFHVVDRQTDRVLSVSEALRVVDDNYEALLQAMQQYSVLQVVSSVKEAPEEDSAVKTVYILAAVIAVLALTVAIIIYVSLTTRNTYKRKLKAAMVKPHDIHDVSDKNKTAVPGSNMYSRQANPLLHAEIPEKIEYDNMSMGSHNSLDSNSVGDPRQESDFDQMEEKEVRMDMFTEEIDYSTIPADPLEAALKHYDMQNIQNKQDNNSTDAIVSPHDIESLQFENKAYIGEFESTEI